MFYVYTARFNIMKNLVNFWLHCTWKAQTRKQRGSGNIKRIYDKGKSLQNPLNYLGGILHPQIIKPDILPLKLSKPVK